MEGEKERGVRKWQFVFPKGENKHAVKWKSLSTPGCLPITTDYMPSGEVLRSTYEEFNKDVSVPLVFEGTSADLTDINIKFLVEIDEISYLIRPPSDRHSHTLALLIMREMASQRSGLVFDGPNGSQLI